jgi:hypothetical protein
MPKTIAGNTLRIKRLSRLDASDFSGELAHGVVGRRGAGLRIAEASA